MGTVNSKPESPKSKASDNTPAKPSASRLGSVLEQVMNTFRMSDSTTKPADELRNRAPANEAETKAPKESKEAKTSSSSSATENSFLTKCFQSAGPILTATGAVFDAVQPLVIKLCAFITQVRAAMRERNLDQFLPALLGLVLAFFGGEYVLTIATVEAFRLGGWDKTKTCLGILYTSYQTALKASREDDQRDDNNDGVADVKQISKKELASRKMLLCLEVCDPMEVTGALNGLTAACCAVLATLRIQFARIVTLGLSISQFLNAHAERHMRAPLQQVVPPKYHKWIGPGVSYACKSLGISLAWIAGRFLAAIQSGLRGGQLFTRCLFTYLRRTGHMTTDVDEKDPLFIGVSVVVACAGIWWQVKNFFRIPFPFNIVLFPLSLLESTLSFLVGDVTVPAA